jgi:hypothetical protein
MNWVYVCDSIPGGIYFVTGLLAENGRGMSGKEGAVAFLSYYGNVKLV